MKKSTFVRRVLVGLTALMSLGTVAAAGTLDDVKAKGYIDCGVDGTLPGFSSVDANGVMRGLDADTCRAVAAVVFGDAEKIRFKTLSAKVRFTALQSGEVDMLSRNTTWTASRDNSLGLDFTTVNFYDGQGFMVRRDMGVKSALELDGATVCVTAGTTTELNASDYFRTNGMQYELVSYEGTQEGAQSYEGGRCDTLTSDSSQLAALRSQMSNPNDHMILPEIISKEPLGPVVRHGDNQWGDIVRWTLFALVNAEELGVTAANADQMRNSPNPSIQRLLGTSGTFGEDLGVSNDWAYNAVKAVGNFGEMYERNIAPIGLSRGINGLWNRGGILYAPPVR